MAPQKSYAKLGKDFAHDLRQQVGSSEKITDVTRSFSHISAGFLREALGSDIDIYDEDVIFTPKGKKKYKFSKRVKMIKEFSEGIADSDLENIIEKFADTASNRYKHLSKNPLKSQLKIRAQAVLS